MVALRSLVARGGPGLVVTPVHWWLVVTPAHGESWWLLVAPSSLVAHGGPNPSSLVAHGGPSSW